MNQQGHEGNESHSCNTYAAFQVSDAVVKRQDYDTAEHDHALCRIEDLQVHIPFLCLVMTVGM